MRFGLTVASLDERLPPSTIAVGCRMPATAPTETEYERCVLLSERVSWTVDEILAVDQQFDFSRPFLPEALVNLTNAPLSAADRLRLNHIRANSYLNLFVFVEEYIVATAMRHAVAEQFGSPAALRALLRFADEEIKHQQLFRRFRTAFERGFGVPCAVVDNAVEVAGYILSKSPLGVMIATLHLELVTQQHYVRSVREGASEENIEPLFRSLLKHHWIEESQHARIDALEIAKLVVDADASVLEQGLVDYIEIMNAFDGVLAQQVEHDLQTLGGLLATPLTDAETAQLRAQQHASYRQNFLLDGLEHPVLLASARTVLPDAEARVRALGARFR